MFIKRLHPTLSRDYVACARTYALDIASSLLLFFCTSVMAGRVWRFPFDDELNVLSPIECCHSTIELLTYYLSGNDIHPPNSFLLFHGLQHLGLSAAGMRLCSLAMTGLALALIHLLALTFIAQRNRGAVALSSRLIAVLLFGLSALAVSQGDAIRWYPLFAMLIAMFVTLYLAGGSEAARLWSAVPLGLAASTNFLAVLVAAPFVLYRYGLQRKFRPSFDATYWFVAALFAGLGFYSAYSIFTKRLSYLAESEFYNGPIRAITTDVLGFFGGCALGIGQAWIIVPAVVISVVAMFSQIDRRQLADPVHLLLLMLAATTVLVLPGFATPRSFLYLAPMLTAVLVLFLDRQRARNARVAVALVSLILAASIGAIANINNGTHPFKRNSVIPYQSIIDFIQGNEKGSVLVVSTDIVIPWVLRHQHERDGSCVSYFFDAHDCFAAERRYDSIFFIVGHSDRSADANFMRKFNSTLDTVTSGRRKAATIHFGVDEDAEIKSRLTGVQLDKYILTVDLYQ
jgi:hypothetical protein